MVVSPSTSPSETNPLLVELPAELDTNNTYRLAGPNGDHWDVVYDTLTECWRVLDF